MIELRNVSKTFESGSKDKDVHAVKNVSLTIEDGEIFGIIGFSGAGKSTLVRCINLLERPTSGEVIIDGQDLTKYSEKEPRAPTALTRLSLPASPKPITPTKSARCLTPCTRASISRRGSNQIAIKAVRRLPDSLFLCQRAPAIPQERRNGWHLSLRRGYCMPYSAYRSGGALENVSYSSP